MSITETDKNNYLIGLLILIRNTGSLTESNKNIIENVANILEYNHYFVEYSIMEILENRKLNPEPPKFSSRQLAEVFVRDCMRFTFKNNALNLNAIRWLLNVIKENKLSIQWFYLELENFLDHYNPDSNKGFEIQKHVKKVYN
jgi:hypothetical protein